MRSEADQEDVNQQKDCSDERNHDKDLRNVAQGRCSSRGGNVRRGHFSRVEPDDFHPKLRLRRVPCHARRSMVIRMTLLTTERLFLHCGAHTTEPNTGLIRPVPPIPDYQTLPFSVARGLSEDRARARDCVYAVLCVAFVPLCNAWADSSRLPAAGHHGQVRT